MSVKLKSIIRPAACLMILICCILTNGRGEDKVEVYKWPKDHNPVMVQHFGADPWAMVYQDRVYLYMTGDEPLFLANGQIRTNDYSNIRSLRVISSDDLVNWTDHGAVAAAGRNGAAKWASNSWAPCAAWKEIDGKDRFFLYFANSGGGIGVLTSDSPVGPFTDPLGKPLISRRTPNCEDVTWLFDPAVLLDEDGTGYLYFGGGIPTGREADPGTARAVRLGADMISLDGDPVAIDAPWLFEDSGINRIGDTYVYSYCTNFQVPAAGSREGFGGGEIVYMTSDSPLGPYTYGGRVLKNPGAYFGVGGNNHHCIFQFHDRWYITYHAATVDRDKKWNAGYRSTFVDRLLTDASGLPTLTRGTMEGVDQLKSFDPYAYADASTAVSMAGAETFLQEGNDLFGGTGKMAVRSTAEKGWTALSDVDFGSDGAAVLEIVCRSREEAVISVAAEKPLSKALGSVTIPAGEEWQTVKLVLEEPIVGKICLFFRFESAGIEMSGWTAAANEEAD